MTVSRGCDWYDRVYRKAHPVSFPYSPNERQMELQDLWPSEQEKFKRLVDKVVDCNEKVCYT